MEFLGVDDWPSPLLKDAIVGVSRARELYSEVALKMRKLYRECRLVHADLSEYNMM
jgi:RIO kinase 1